MIAVRFALRRLVKSYCCRRRGGAAPATVVTALDGVDLDILERQVNALVGRSGAGKSTLARILMGFIVPDSGAVLYQGRPLTETPRPVFRRCNQMVFQNPLQAVNPLFTAAWIISEPLRVLKSAAPLADGFPGERALRRVSLRPDAVSTAGTAALAAIGERIAEVLEQLELSRDCLRRRPCELSGGELQRVVLARALVLKPEFLILDEPFSALDDLTAIKIVRLLKGVFRRLKLGVLFIGHHPRHVRELADRVVVLEKGRLLSPGV